MVERPSELLQTCTPLVLRRLQADALLPEGTLCKFSMLSFCAEAEG